MVRGLLCRLCVLMLVATSGAGPLLSNAQAGTIAGKTISAAGAGMPMSQGCDDCDGESGMNPKACVAICAHLGTHPATLPAEAPLFTPQPVAFTIAEPVDGTGRLGPPDPAPPRPSLSSPSIPG